MGVGEPHTLTLALILTHTRTHSRRPKLPYRPRPVAGPAVGHRARTVCRPPPPPPAAFPYNTQYPTPTLLSAACTKLSGSAPGAGSARGSAILWRGTVSVPWVSQLGSLESHTLRHTHTHTHTPLHFGANFFGHGGKL